MPRSDPQFLALTRVPNAFGVPLWGFFIAAGADVMLFSVLVHWVFTPGMGALLASGSICGALYLLAVFAMARLSGWEPRWYVIILRWGQTVLPYRFADATRAFGGTTFRPGPVLLRTYEDVRNHVG